MTKPHILAESPAQPDRRGIRPAGRATLGGVLCRDEDVESTKALHSVAILFRVMSGLLFLLMGLQVFNGLTSAFEMSYGVLAAEAIQLVIFAGLLWGAGDLADLFVKSHCDLRALRVLLGRTAYLVGQPPAGSQPGPGDADTARGSGDGLH